VGRGPPRPQRNMPMTTGVPESFFGTGSTRTDFADAFGILGDVPLGSGLTAQVWRAAERAGSPEEVAAKVYKQDVEVQTNSSTPSAPAGLRKEVDLLAAAQGHPNVLQLRGLFLLAGDEVPQEGYVASVPAPRWCVTTELCVGGDLCRMVERGVLSEVAAKIVATGVLSALEHVHAHGILHRDVKLENVLFRGDGTPVLADFGLSCHISDQQVVRTSCGSPGYIAPEVLLKKGWRAESDIFSTGVVLYTSLAGRKPFEGRDIMEICVSTVRTRPNFSRLQVSGEASWQLKAFLRLLLSKEPEKRPFAAEALQEPWFAPGAVSDLPSCMSAETSAPSATSSVGAAENSGTRASSASRGVLTLAPLSDDEFPLASDGALSGQASCEEDDDEVMTPRGSSHGSSSLLSAGHASWQRVKRLSLRITPAALKPQSVPTRKTRQLRNLFPGGNSKISSVVPHAAQGKKPEGPPSFASTAWTSPSSRASEIESMSAAEDEDIDCMLADAQQGEDFGLHMSDLLEASEAAGAGAGQGAKVKSGVRLPGLWRKQIGKSAPKG